jgi:hypothetical protein
LDVLLLASQILLLLKESSVLLLKAFVLEFEVFALPVELAAYCNQLLLCFEPCLSGGSFRRLDESLAVLVRDRSNDVAGRCGYLGFELTAECGP